MSQVYHHGGRTSIRCGQGKPPPHPSPPLINHPNLTHHSNSQLTHHQRWTEKGFGFIERPDFGDSIFCHSRETPDRAGLVPGSKVSFVYENDEKGGKAKEVLIEEAAVEDESVREMGTIKRWNAEKGFGFIGRANGGDDAFVHKKDCGGKDLVQGQGVSFVFEDSPKGASAKNVREEGEITMEEPVEEDEGEREFGKVKDYNQEKGFTFIGRCAGGDDIFGHKREFGNIEPYVGQPVSFVLENTEKGDTAKKIREGKLPIISLYIMVGSRRKKHTDWLRTIQRRAYPNPFYQMKVENLALSRYEACFLSHFNGNEPYWRVKNFNKEKGFGFIVRKKGGDDAHVHEKQCNGLTLEKDMCVSFVCEDSGKGPAAKDLREEDPARVARVTAKVHYGKVEVRGHLPSLLSKSPPR